MGVEGAPPSAGEIQEVRQKLARSLSEVEAGGGDMERLNTDDKYLTDLNDPQHAQVEERDPSETRTSRRDCWPGGRCSVITGLMAASVSSSDLSSVFSSQGQRRTKAVGVLCIQTCEGLREDGGYEEVLCLHVGEARQGGTGPTDNSCL